MNPPSKVGIRPLISVAEAAALAGLSKTVAYRLAAAGTLPGLVRLPGARMLVRRRVLEDWLCGTDQFGPASTDSKEASMSTSVRRG